jgi:hypothetical protein
MILHDGRFSKNGQLLIQYFVRINLTTENVSDNDKGQNIFSPNVKLVGQKIVTDVQLFPAYS